MSQTVERQVNKINIISNELKYYNTNVANCIIDILEIETEIKNKINIFFLQNKYNLINNQIIYTSNKDFISNINGYLNKITLKILELYNLKMNNKLNYNETLESSKIMEKLNKVSLCNKCSESIIYNNSIEELHILNINDFINIYLGKINDFINYCNKIEYKIDNKKNLLEILNNDINIIIFINNFIRYKCYDCSNKENNIKNKINIENEINLRKILKNNFC
jgi:hypothetical protein